MKRLCVLAGVLAFAVPRPIGVLAQEAKPAPVNEHKGVDRAERSYDRLIVLSDEQAHDTVKAPRGRGYLVNVASYQNGVGYGAWTHVDGWSEAVLDYIREYENL